MSADLSSRHEVNFMPLKELESHQLAIATCKSEHLTDIIWAALDTFIRNDQLDLIDDMLACWPIEFGGLGGSDTDVYITLLTVTLPIKNQLQNRYDFFHEVKRQMSAAKYDTYEELKGLE